MTQKMLAELEHLINYHFIKPELAELAFTHASFRPGRNNEKLEFFGDSVLNLVVTRYLVTAWHGKSEGEMSKIRSKAVCTESLASVVAQMGLDRFMLLGRSETKAPNVNRRRIHANLYEALTGAIFIDGSFDDAINFVMLTLKKRIDDIANADVLSDFKTALQEIVQSHKEWTLEYKLASRSGPDHAPVFCYRVMLNGGIAGEGCGQSKSEAQLRASQAAYEKLKKEGADVNC